MPARFVGPSPAVRVAVNYHHHHARTQTTQAGRRTMFLGGTAALVAGGEAADKVLAQPGPLHDAWQYVLGMSEGQVIGATATALGLLHEALSDPEKFGYAFLFVAPILALLLRRLNQRR